MGGCHAKLATNTPHGAPKKKSIFRHFRKKGLTRSSGQEISCTTTSKNSIENVSDSDTDHRSLIRIEGVQVDTNLYSRSRSISNDNVDFAYCTGTPKIVQSRHLDYTTTSSASDVSLDFGDDNFDSGNSNTFTGSNTTIYCKTQYEETEDITSSQDTLLSPSADKGSRPNSIISNAGEKEDTNPKLSLSVPCTTSDSTTLIVDIHQNVVTEEDTNVKSSGYSSNVESEPSKYFDDSIIPVTVSGFDSDASSITSKTSTPTENIRRNDCPKTQEEIQNMFYPDDDLPFPVQESISEVLRVPNGLQELSGSDENLRVPVPCTETSSHIAQEETVPRETDLEGAIGGLALEDERQNMGDIEKAILLVDELQEQLKSFSPIRAFGVKLLTRKLCIRCLKGKLEETLDYVSGLIEANPRLHECRNSFEVVEVEPGYPKVTLYAEPVGHCKHHKLKCPNTEDDWQRDKFYIGPGDGIYIVPKSHIKTFQPGQNQGFLSGTIAFILQDCHGHPYICTSTHNWMPKNHVFIVANDHYKHVIGKATEMSWTLGDTSGKDATDLMLIRVPKKKKVPTATLR